MECEICFLTFNSTIRRPKFLPCGHSACLACLERLSMKRCPLCRMVISIAVKDLPDNFSLLKPLETICRPLQLWCSCCEAVAKSECIAKHNLKSIHAVLGDEVVQLSKKLVGKLEEEEALANQDCIPEKALQVLRLVRQPGTSFQFTVGGQGGGEALKANWTNAPEEQSKAVIARLLSLVLAKKGCLQHEDQAKSDPAQQGGGAEQGEREAANTPDFPIIDLKVDNYPSNKRMEEIQQTVRQSKVRKLTKLNCSVNGAWSVQLLQLVAPDVEELSATMVLCEQLLVIHSMLKLRRLKVYGTTSDVEDDSYPALLPPTSAHHAGLRWLMVAYLPYLTTISLINSHAATLEELWLAVSAGGGKTWPDGCHDLALRLELCGFPKLRKLVLARMSSAVHYETRCLGQIRALERVLPEEVEVLCEECDSDSVSRSF